MDDKNEILIIDDDEGTRKTLTFILKKKGFNVVTAGTGEEGLKLAKGRKISVALLDINLPDIEGIRLIAPLKEMHPGLSVIMITGFASLENAMRALNEGATGYVLKPVNIDEILSKIQDALERQHLIKTKLQAEEALRVSEEKYRSLVENINDVIYSLDERGVITYISPAIEKIAGYPPSQITGHSFTGFITKEDLPGVMQTFEAAKKGTIASFPFRIVTKTGDQRWLSNSSDPAFTNGAFSGVRGVLSDITERRQADEALIGSERKFRDIFNNTTDAIHIHGIMDDGSPDRFTDVNEVACRMLGYTREEMLAKTPLDIGTGYHDPPMERVIEEQLTTGTARFETEHRAKNGTIIPVEVNTHVVTIEGTKVMLGVVRDITERKKAEALMKHFNEELEQEVKVRTEELSASLDEKVILLREIHHRVKNNLQIIISLVNLQMRQIDDKRLKQVMAETQNRVRAMSLVHEKLYQSEDISHIDLDSYTRFLATHLISFYGVDSRQVALDIDIGKIMVGINTAIPLGLIINELASNALKHAFPDGKTGLLSIMVREVDTTLYLTVKDDGIGLPADFNWRNAESLGLRLVISLVGQLDGTIELDRSTGTAFTVVVQEKE